MRDLKSQKTSRIKKNRKRGSQPRDWKALFLRLFQICLLAGSVSLTIAGGLLASRMLFFSDYFRVDSIRVADNHRVAIEEILDLSDIEMGAHIFELDLAMIGRKIEENPWIAVAAVERVFPREIIIRVKERTPRAIINLGYLYYVDASGAVFKLLDPGDSLDYPVITGLDRRFLLENEAEARRQLVEAAGVLDDLAHREDFNLDQVAELNISQTEGFSLCTYVGGVPIRVGFDHFSAKLDMLEKIYGELKPRLSSLRYIDLNVMDRVIVRVDKRTHGRG
jgi:cell division protein FtsQ